MENEELLQRLKTLNLQIIRFEEHNLDPDLRLGRVEGRVIEAIVGAWRPEVHDAPTNLGANDVENITTDPAGNTTTVEQQAAAGEHSQTRPPPPPGANEEAAAQDPPHWSDWKLSKTLIAKDLIVDFNGFGAKTPAEKSVIYKKLADMLEIRAIFVLALFSAGPDSSDLYYLEGNDFTMPIG